MPQKPIMFAILEYRNGKGLDVAESSNYTGYIPHKGDTISVPAPSPIFNTRAAYTVTDVQFYYDDLCQLEAVVLVVEFLKFVSPTKR